MPWAEINQLAAAGARHSDEQRRQTKANTSPPNLHSTLTRVEARRIRYTARRRTGPACVGRTCPDDEQGHKPRGR